jgi:transcriptional regulator with XRE-family HTH domain
MSQEQDLEEVRRLLNLLRTLMRMLGFSNREVERRMEVNHGSVSRVFSSQIEAKLELVLGAARAIGLEYDEFFAFAYPDRRPPELESPAATKVHELLEDLRPATPSRILRVPEERPEPTSALRHAPVSREELIEELRKTVREVLSQSPPGGETAPRRDKEGNGHD